MFYTCRRPEGKPRVEARVSVRRNFDPPAASTPEFFHLPTSGEISTPFALPCTLLYNYVDDHQK